MHVYINSILHVPYITISRTGLIQLCLLFYTVRVPLLFLCVLNRAHGDFGMAVIIL